MMRCQNHKREAEALSSSSQGSHLFSENVDQSTDIIRFEETPVESKAGPDLSPLEISFTESRPPEKEIERKSLEEALEKEISISEAANPTELKKPLTLESSIIPRGQPTSVQGN